MFAAILASLALLAEPVQAYELELTVVENGVEALSSKSQIVIDEPAHATVPHKSGMFELYASLNTMQGDAHARTLQLDLSAYRDGEMLAEPSITLVRGEPFQLRSGGPDGAEVRIVLTPLGLDE